MDEALILQERDDLGVATVTLNRPEVHNAFNDVVIAELSAVLQSIADDADIRVLVLRSEGKSFSAGADLNWMKAAVSNSQAENEASAAKMAQLFHRLDSMPMPTIARVQGSAFAGGLGLVVCCDMAIGARHAKFAVTEVKLGLIPAVISPYLTAAIGPGAARRYFHTAEVFDAEEAKRIGILHEAVDLEDLDESVNGLIKAILGNAPEANAACKKLIREIGSTVDESTRADTARRIAAIRATEEAQEGIAAFFDKRAPGWVMDTGP
ncbi:MAG: enoyl-CoA hydratase/isomerase family protein [Proteobacteria bacterium]|nr:enoyl-CoA hydratase/isomerase family protein [Pseudomonadota bacterium]